MSSDPDLTVLAGQIHGKDVAQLNELAVVLFERGKKLISLDDALADEVCSLLQEGRGVPRDVLGRLQSAADEADGHYLDILDSEGADSSRCREAFCRARLLMALWFAAQGEKTSLLESVYESFVGTQRHPDMLEIIRRVAVA